MDAGPIFRVPAFQLHGCFNAAELGERLPWSIEKYKVLDAADKIKTDNPVMVCVIDTVGWWTHEDLPTITEGHAKNFSSSPSLIDALGHGTHVAGTIAATGRNNIGVAGLAWRHCRLALAKALNDRGIGSDDGIAASIDWGLSLGARIFNLSLSMPRLGPGQTNKTLQACERANAKGAVIVCAAGNSGGPVEDPASRGYCIAVSAFDEQERLANFSNRGKEVAVSAPGVEILSTYPMTNGGYAVLSGTSMAAPHVVGTLALYYVQHQPPVWNADFVRSLFAKNKLDLGQPGRDDMFGYGLFDLGSTLIPVVPPVPPVDKWDGTEIQLGKLIKAHIPAKPGDSVSFQFSLGATTMGEEDQAQAAKLGDGTILKLLLELWKTKIPDEVKQGIWNRLFDWITGKLGAAQAATSVDFSAAECPEWAQDLAKQADAAEV